MKCLRLFLLGGRIDLLFDYTQTKLLISHKIGGYRMQWVLQDIPLGRNIQTMRMAKNMTQVEVVEQLQLMGSMISRSTLANIEAGRRNIKASDLKALQKLFGVEYEEFFRD